MKKKKDQIIGTQSYINRDTGELIDMHVVQSDDYEKDNNFHKLFLRDFTAALALVANQKTKLFCWIISNLTKDNLLLYTYRQIADKTGVSYATVADTMKTLQAADCLRRQASGYYIMNPNIIFKGSYPRRCMAIKAYRDAISGDGASAEQIRLQTIKNTISRLQKQEKRVQRDIAALEAMQTEE